MILRNLSSLFLLTLSLTLVLTPLTNVYAVVPGQVTGLTATAQTNALTIDLSWTAVTATPAVTGYKIERKIGAGAFSTLVANTGTTTTTYSDTGLSQGTTYTYRVSAINADGTGPASAEASATTNSAPGAPTGLTATKQTNALTIDLSWTAPASNGGSVITGYKIERESPVGGGFSTLVANTGTTATTYSDTGLSANTQYNYRVSAINAIGTGSASGTASATTNNVPGTPTGLTATAQADVLTIDLSWTTPSSDGGSAITGYKIERKIGAGAFSTLVANTGTTTTTYSDTGLSRGTQYTYRVSALNAIGTGSSSSEASATTSDVPATPTLSISVIKTGISFSWTTPNNMGSSITGYKIERASPSGSTYETLVGNTGNTVTSSSDSCSKGQSVAYRISAINAIGTGSASNEASAICFSRSDTCYDCNAPSFTKGLTNDEPSMIIAGKEFKITSNANKVNTVFTNTGTPFPIKLMLYDDSGPDRIQHVALYINLRENQLTESQSDTYIVWEKGKEVVVHDPHGFLKDAKVTAQISAEDNRELDVTFDLFFVKPLEKSHIIISMWDYRRNGSVTKIFDALQVSGLEIQTDQDITGVTPAQNIPPISEKLREEIKKIANDGMTDDDVAFMLNEMTKEGIVDFKELNNKQKEMSLMESKIITSESQDGRVSVEKGYSTYYEILIVKGDVSDYTLGTNIGLEITKPSTSTQMLSLYADKNGYFYVPIMLDDIKDGAYLIKASYKDATIGELKFTLDDKADAETYTSNVEDTVRIWLQGKITDENFIKRVKQIVK